MMRLALISAPCCFDGEVETIKALFDAGLEIFHLRKPGEPEEVSRRLIESIPEEFRSRIVVHDHFHLKGEYGLGGIHLGKRNPTVPQGYSGRVSASCHSFDEVRQSLEYCSYVFLSPIFDSISKQGYMAAFSPEVLRAAQRDGIIGPRVLALGGVDAGNILKVKEYGFGGAALLGAIWNSPDPVGSFLELKDLP